MSTDLGPSNNTPAALGATGAATAGVADDVSRSDHAHNPLQVVTHTVNYTDLTVDTTNGTQTINLGAALPVGAIPVAAQIQIATPFAGAAAPTMDVGIAGGNQLKSAFDTTQAAGRYVPGAPAAGQYDGAQLTLKFTPATGQKLHTGSSAGSLTVSVYYFAAY